MSQNEINELELAREMQLMYNYARGFTPIGDKLNQWQGDITIKVDDKERKIPIEILIPLKFPQYPPRVIIKEKNIKHPNIEKDGNILLRITHEWKADTHVYQIIYALQELFAKVQPQFLEKGTDIKTRATVQAKEETPIGQRKVAEIDQTITNLQERVREKDEELQRLQSELIAKSSSEKFTKFEDNPDVLLPADKKVSEKILLQAQNAALADLLSTLDEKFKDGEISPVDFTKLYRRYSKELYIIQKKINA